MKRYYLLLCYLLCTQLHIAPVWGDGSACIDKNDQQGVAGSQVTNNENMQSCKTTGGLAFKKDNDIETTKITTSYVLLIVFLLLAITALSFFRNRLKHGAGLQSLLNPSTSVNSRLNVIERKRMAGQTYASLLSVDDQLLVVVENNTAISICEINPKKSPESIT